MNRYEEVEKYGLQTRDKKYLLKHLVGEKLTPMQAIHSKCYECMGYYVDGKSNCQVPDCPLYQFHRQNPHRITVKRFLTDEQRVEIGERLKKAHTHIR